MKNLGDKIIAYESGELSQTEIIDLFAGLAWTLQGCYGRTAKDLIGAGYISPTGDVLTYELGV
jgi:hypothetical protein